MADILYFLKLGDIKGESIVKTHKDEIEVLSFGWGATQSGGVGGPGGGGGAGKVEVDELTFVATSGLASPPIFTACATGKHLPEAILTGYRAGAKGLVQEFLVIKLKDVLITSYSQFAGEAERPEDEVSLVFGELEFVASAGSKTTKATWDLKANKA